MHKKQTEQPKVIRASPNKEEIKKYRESERSRNKRMWEFGKLAQNNISAS